MIDRRRFLSATVASGAGMVLGSGCTPGSPGAPPQQEPNQVPPFELDEVDVAELQRSMSSGERTARSITELYLGRIEELNAQGPELRAIIETNPDAIAIAEALDAERAAGELRGPLHGIPVVIKDNIDTNDRMTTTAGSLALEGSVPPRDSYLVERLRQAGAIVLAKANLSEWANYRGARSTSGWSARGGQCRNPYALDRTPWGSSAGSGVAAAANLCALAIGTETGGSIMAPSSANGVVGIKPTVGLWSRSGIIPISHIQDTAGPMTRTVRDGAILLGALTGVDPRDGATAASAGHAEVDYTRFLDAAGLNGARIGVLRAYENPPPGLAASLRFDPYVTTLFDEALSVMREAGAVVVDPTNLRLSEDSPVTDRVSVVATEFKAGINAYLAGLGPDAPVKTLAEIIDFNVAHADREMPHFGQERMEAAQASGPLTDPEYQAMRAAIHQAVGPDGIDRVLLEHELDAIVVPTVGPPPFIDHILGDRVDQGFGYALVPVIGYPSVSVPMGFMSGLPLGLCFFGTAWSEPTLLRLAYSFEQATGHRRRPTFAETLG